MTVLLASSFLAEPVRAADRATEKDRPAAQRKKPAAEIAVPVRGSGRLVKQVAQQPTTKSAKPTTKADRDEPRTRQGRVMPSTPALLARGHNLRDTQLRAPTIQLWHITSHETFALRPDQKGGGFSRGQMAALSRFLRCHYTNRRGAMESRLISLLYATARHFDNAKLTIISGFRSAKVARMKGNPRSPHKRGVACDFRIEGVALPVLRDYLRNTFHGVGVGYYPISNFVHLDVGRKQDAFWIDYSGPGQRAQYSDSPEDDLRSGLAEARAQEAREAREAAPSPDVAPSPEAAPAPSDVHTQGDL